MEKTHPFTARSEGLHPTRCKSILIKQRGSGAWMKEYIRCLMLQVWIIHRVIFLLLKTSREHFVKHSRPFLFSSPISHHLATPIRFDPWFLPQVLQPQSQIFLPPYHQYRKQVMMPGAVQQVTRFPSAAVQPSQFWPQVYQVLQGPSSYTYPPVPFYGNPIERAQESFSVLRDVKSTQPQNILAHVSPSLEF